MFGIWNINVILFELYSNQLLQTCIDLDSYYNSYIIVYLIANLSYELIPINYVLYIIDSILSIHHSIL